MKVENLKDEYCEENKRIIPNTNRRALISLGELATASENCQLVFTTNTEKFCDKPFIC